MIIKGGYRPCESIYIKSENMVSKSVKKSGKFTISASASNYCICFFFFLNGLTFIRNC